MKENRYISIEFSSLIVAGLKEDCIILLLGREPFDTVLY